MVVDADGLKLLAKLEDWAKLLPKNSVLTPHPGEMAVLTGLKIDQIQSERVETALKYAKKWNQVVVLKGALTVIASPDQKARIIPVATAALARAGTGDVLAGIIAGLIAQGVPSFDAATAGAWIHAHAGLGSRSISRGFSVCAGIGCARINSRRSEQIKSLIIQGMGPPERQAHPWIFSY